MHNESDAHNNFNCYEININKQEGHELSRKPLDDFLQRWEIDDEQRRLAEALDFPPQNETWFFR